MNLDVYDPTNTTLLGTLTGAFGKSFVDRVGKLGYGLFSVDMASTADIALLQPRRWVRWRTGASAGDDDIFGCVVQDRPADLGAEIQPETGNRIATVTFECPGGLDILGYQKGGAVLRPHGGLEGRQQNPRMFGWFSADYDDSGWANPVSESRLGGALTTPGWPDKRAVAFQAQYPGDRTLYRRTLLADGTTDTPARMHLVASVNTAVRVWLDNEVVLEKPSGERGLYTKDIPYEDLDHQLAIETEGGGGRMGWSWIALEDSGDADGTLKLGEVLRRTFDPVEFPSATPWKSFEGGFDWLAAAYDDSSWDDPIGDGPLTTAGWPDATAVAYRAQAVRSRYRLTTTPAASPTQGTMYVAATYNTNVRVFVDGTEVMHKPDKQRGLFVSSVEFSDAAQQIAVVVTGGGRWGMSWMADSGGTVFANTSDSYGWTFSIDPGPGVTTGFVAKTGIDEAQDRDLLDGVTYDFDEDVDSGGVAWSVKVNRGFRIQQLGSTLDELSGIEGEPHMTPDGVLQLFVAKGTDRTATVNIDAPLDLALAGRGPQATRLLVETGGGMGELINATAEAELGTKMEQFVQLGTDISPADIGPSLLAQLVKDGQTYDAADVDLPAGIVPYVDLLPGDTITCNGRDGSVPVRVVGVALDIDDENGDELWTLSVVPT